MQLATSGHAVLPSGSTRYGDIVFVDSDSIVVGEVQSFWGINGQVMVAIQAFRCLNNDRQYWSNGSPVRAMVAGESIVDAVSWRLSSPLQASFGSDGIGKIKTIAHHTSPHSRSSLPIKQSRSFSSTLATGYKFIFQHPCNRL